MIKTLTKIIKDNLEDNKQGYKKIGSDYWRGRLYAMEDLVRDIRRIFNK